MSLRQWPVRLDRRAGNRPDKADKGAIVARTPKNTDRDTGTDQPEIEDAVILDEGRPQDPAPEPVAIDEPVQTADDPIADEAAPEAEAPEPAQRSSGPLWVGMILSGAVVAGLGFGSGLLLRPSGDEALQAMLDSQASRLAELESRVAAIPEPLDIGPLQTRITELQQEIDGQKAGLETLGAQTESRLSDLEKRPLADGTLADEALAAYEREIAALRSEIVGQGSRLQDMADATAQQLSQTQEQARQIEQSSADAARNAALSAAVSKLRVALDAGGGFEAPLADLSAAGVEIGPDLALVAADGVATINQLQTDFPQAARNALAAARREGVAGEAASGVLAYLRNQFDVRSVVPHEGSDPDAVLSRAQAALADNRLADALAELDALPEVARAEMSGWIAAATARRAAIVATDSLAQSLNAF